MVPSSQGGIRAMPLLEQHVAVLHSDNHVTNGAAAANEER
jgi:hypothetical protein